MKKKLLAGLATGLLCFCSVGSIGATTIEMVDVSSQSYRQIIDFNFVSEGSGSSFNLLNLQGASFSEHFSGQTLSYVGEPGYPERGDEKYEVLSGSPVGSLTLQPSTNDRDNVGVGWWTGDESAMLHGYINSEDNYSSHEGAISVLFDADQIGFGVDIYVGMEGTVDIDIFSRDGSLLAGFDYLGIPSNPYRPVSYAFTSLEGASDIAGFSIYSTAGDPVSYLIDNLRFDTPAPIPEPATIALLGIGLSGLAGAEVRRRLKKKAVDNS